MPKPSEHKTVQARILEYAEAIGWTLVSCEEAEQRRMGFDSRKAQRHLKRFIEWGLLQKEGPSSATKYEVRNP